MRWRGQPEEFLLSTPSFEKMADDALEDGGALDRLAS
jgi:hypothetical protein